MKNNLIRKLLCITLISAMIVSSSFSALASEMGSASENEDGVVWQPDVSDEPVVEPDITDTPEPTEEPAITPGPTADPTDEPSVTPSPTVTVSPTETPTVKPTVTPTGIPGAGDIEGIPVDKGEERPNDGNQPGDDDPRNPSITVDDVVAAIDAIGEVTLDKEGLIQSARNVYEMLSEEQKTQVSNYSTLVAAEEALEQLKGSGEDTEPEDPKDQGAEDPEEGNQVSVIEGPATMISSDTHVINLKAGRTFYLKQLKSNYSLTFSEKFEDVMDEIEEEYIKTNKLGKEDGYLVHNWQDILAVYVMEQERAGKSSFKLNDSAKDALAAIFAEMNEVVRDKENIALVNYKNMHVEDYIKVHRSDLTKDEIKTLRKYADQDCALLCATITAAKGFIRQSAGEEVSEERVAVIQAGYSLVGKVAYFWGGKSSVLGWDDRWGSAAKVSSEGSSSTGKIRAYGLDCSGFVDWAFNNGYQDTDIEDLVGHGTSDQWNRAETIQAKDAQAGDLVFQRGPEAGSDNHVGILVGKSSNGDWIAVHCSGSQNGVTVGEAYSASFRYIRRPTVYPTLEELKAEKGKQKTELLEAANRKNALRQAAENENPNKIAQLD